MYHLSKKNCRSRQNYWFQRKIIVLYLPYIGKQIPKILEEYFFPLDSRASLKPDLDQWINMVKLKSERPLLYIIN